MARIHSVSLGGEQGNGSPRGPVHPVQPTEAVPPGSSLDSVVEACKRCMDTLHTVYESR